MRAVDVTALALPARAVNRRQKAPRAESLRPIVTTANLSRAEARLDDRRVRGESTFPPDILLPGAKHSKDVKCLALGHARTSAPHSPTSLSDSKGPSHGSRSDQRQGRRTVRLVHQTTAFDLLGLCARTWQLNGIMIGICAQCRKRRLKIVIAFQHIGLIEVIEFERLGQPEDVFGAITPIGRTFDCLC